MLLFSTSSWKAQLTFLAFSTICLPTEAANICYLETSIECKESRYPYKLPTRVGQTFYAPGFRQGKIYVKLQSMQDLHAHGAVNVRYNFHLYGSSQPYWIVVSRPGDDGKFCYAVADNCDIEFLDIEWPD
ncbi:hypothetical protein WAI453_001277 [Rhynchosporium graminicola]